MNGNLQSRNPFGAYKTEETDQKKSARGAKKISYQMVGRYMKGSEVTGYHLQSIETGKAGRYTKEQVYYLAGRDQITNCEGSLGSEGAVNLSGRGMRIQDLPVMHENGKMSNTDAIGKVKKNQSAEQTMERLKIIAQVPEGKKVPYYWVINVGGGKAIKSREEIIEKAKNNLIVNARVQIYNGKYLLRSRNGEDDLSKLPCKDKQGNDIER